MIAFQSFRGPWKKTVKATPTAAVTTIVTAEDLDVVAVRVTGAVVWRGELAARAAVVATETPALTDLAVLEPR